MQLVPICFGVACLTASAAARFADKEDRSDAVFIGVALVASWAASNVAWGHNHVDMFPVMDGALAAFAVTIYRLRGGNWRFAFAGLALSQMALHLLYICYGAAFLVAYLYALDFTFAAEILVVGWGGGRNVLVRSRLWFRRLRRFLSAGLVQERKVRA